MLNVRLQQPPPAFGLPAGGGFEDPYHFSRVFRRVYGVAPSRFAAIGQAIGAGDAGPRAT
ncbi:MAG: AraC family transcriptional regulator [Kiritimatiellae bacterium]|nr:AraC family transcriptional regulator [Kiritimatiellia bacterium]